MIRAMLRATPALGILAALTLVHGCAASGPCAEYCADMGRYVDECGDGTSQCWDNPEGAARYAFEHGGERPSTHPCDGGAEYESVCNEMWAAVLELDMEIGDGLEVCPECDVGAALDEGGCDAVDQLLSI
jgi:hypothetical protein